MGKRRNAVDLDAPLTDKQARFVAEYIVDFNGSRAAIAAKYAKNSARITASQLLTKPNIQAAIAKATRKTAEKLGFKAEDTLKGLISIAQFDIRKALEFGEEEIEVPAPEKDGRPVGAPRLERRNFVRLKASHEIDDSTAYAITGVSLKKDGSLSFRAADKKGALDTLARHYELVKDVIDVTSGGKTLVEGGATPREIARLLAVALAKAARGGPGQ